MLTLAVILVALAILGLETLLALKASGNIPRAEPFLTLTAVVLTTGVLLILLI